MRTRNSVGAALLCSVAATAAIPATALAAPHPHHDRGLTIAATPSSIVSGEGLYIQGNLSGTNVANQPIQLFHRIGNARTFTYVGTQKTNSSGQYTFSRADGVVTTNRSWFVEGPGRLHSDTIHERVSSIVSLSESTGSAFNNQRVDFSGTVSPNHSGETVVIQEQTGITGNGWKDVARGRIHGLSFNIENRFRDAGDYTLRAYLRGDARNTAGSSDSQTLAVQQRQNASFTVGTSQPSVTAGTPVTISGTLYQSGSTTVAQPNTGVVLYASTDGHGFQEVASSTTDGNGGYTFSETPLYNTVYRVVSATTPAQHTANLYQAVSDVISMSASTASSQVGSAVSFTGSVSPSHGGHWVVLQQLTPRGIWQAIAQTRVNGGGQYGFSYTFGKPGTYSVRARIFGGPLNVGGASTPVSLSVSAAS